MTQPDRAEAMGRRLVRTARRLGMDAAGRRLLEDGFRMAMEPRRTRIVEDHHPDYLHPARTVLILMDDAGVDDPRVLTSALFVETRDPAFAVPDATVAALNTEVAERRARVPVPEEAGDRLLETLLAADPDTARIAAAERLDHARHLHLRAEGEWLPYHQLTCRTYGPVAERTCAPLGRRLEWWCAAFQRRFLGV